ncbi:LysM peptidoglycan-binding domain-containing protein [Oscillibacter sp.]|uniref:LysM peptidoglycan-binding domain-containing protein n=1 Tax=Oscillibacter sp. TaxID=1945593 RepID=UPI0026132821|nr:LysM peptidoglycan-binding domain-containing protein [Oscillibacter sp.]MDD3346822.1 LysM peptidoglycan-binding domain-containing protein [Oscillibacter sp.]
MEYRRRMAAHPVPFGRCVLQDLGSTYRVLQGEGTFMGKNAYREFQKLAAVFCQSGSGVLVHPVWPAEQAYFVALQVTEKPLPDYVHYSFTFWEDCGAPGGLTETDDGVGATSGQGQSAAGGSQHAATVYIVRKGDTLWGIGKRYGVTLTQLIAANPGIKNPNLIYPGDRVTIP